jgi:hypothetical protein
MHCTAWQVRLVSDGSVQLSGFEAEYVCGMVSRPRMLGPGARGVMAPRRFDCVPRRDGIVPCKLALSAENDPSLFRRPPDAPNNLASELAGGAFESGAFCGFLNLSETASPIVISNGPSRYAAGTNCTWRIVAESSIEFRFTMMQTEVGYDVVKLYDGLSTASALLGVFSGAEIPKPFSSAGGAAMLTFTADASIQDDGFEVAINTLAR